MVVLFFDQHLKSFQPSKSLQRSRVLPSSTWRKTCNDGFKRMDSRMKSHQMVVHLITPTSMITISRNGAFPNGSPQHITHKATGAQK
jgi:hypothetical protein